MSEWSTERRSIYGGIRFKPFVGQRSTGCSGRGRLDEKDRPPWDPFTHPPHRASAEQPTVDLSSFGEFIPSSLTWKVVESRFLVLPPHGRGSGWAQTSPSFNVQRSRFTHAHPELYIFNDKVGGLPRFGAQVYGSCLSLSPVKPQDKSYLRSLPLGSCNEKSRH